MMKYAKIAHSIAFVGLLHSNTYAVNKNLAQHLTIFERNLETLRSALPSLEATKALLDAIIEANFKPHVDLDNAIKKFFDHLIRYESFKTSDFIWYDAWSEWAFFQNFYDNAQNKTRPEVLQSFNDLLKKIKQPPLKNFEAVVESIQLNLKIYNQDKLMLPNHSAANELSQNIEAWLKHQKDLSYQVDTLLILLDHLIDVCDDAGNFQGIIEYGFQPDANPGLYSNKDRATFEAYLKIIEEVYGSQDAFVKEYKAWIPIVRELVGKPIGYHINNLPKAPESSSSCQGDMWLREHRK